MGGCLSKAEFAPHIGESESLVAGPGEQLDDVEHAGGGGRRGNVLTSFLSGSYCEAQITEMLSRIFEKIYHKECAGACGGVARRAARRPGNRRSDSRSGGAAAANAEHRDLRIGRAFYGSPGDGNQRPNRPLAL